MLVKFSLKLHRVYILHHIFYISPYVGKIFKFIVFTFLENVLNLAVFIYVLLYTQNFCPQVHLITHPRQREITHSPRQYISKICFPQYLKGVEKTMTCFIKVQSEIVKMNWAIRLFIFCLIFNFFECDDTFLNNIYRIVCC